MTDLQSKLRPLFENIWERETFESPPSIELAARVDEALMSAAHAKCIEMNLALNGNMFEENLGFAAIANLRGLVEDLIVLDYLQRFNSGERVSYFSSLNRKNILDGMARQAAFFAANNPSQPVAAISTESMTQKLEENRTELRRFWASVGEPKKDGPSIRDMAERTQLLQSYDFLYFLSSNFVHFNTHTLLRMGWGPEDGPFAFSLKNFSRYYADVASLYGATIFLGFYFRLGESQYSEGTLDDVDAILRQLDNLPRWPEIVTFEELNEKPPIPTFLSFAMRKVGQESGEAVPFESILREMRGLS